MDTFSIGKRWEGYADKTWPHVLREPIVQRNAAARFGAKLDAKSNFSERYDANIELVERLNSNKCDDFGFGIWSSQLGQDIGVKQRCHPNTM